MTRADAVDRIIETIEADCPTRLLKENQPMQATMLGASQAIRYLTDLQKQFEAFEAVLRRGYQNPSNASATSARQQFELALEHARVALSLEQVVGTPTDSLVSYVRAQLTAPKRRFAEFVCALLADNVEGGVCGELTPLGDGTLALTHFFRPYGPEGLDHIPVGRIANGDVTREFWKHSYEWSIDEELSQLRQVIGVPHQAHANRLLRKMPWYLRANVQVYRGKQLSWYAEPLDADPPTSHTIDVRPDTLTCIVFSHYVLHQSSTRDRRLQAARLRRVGDDDPRSQIATAFSRLATGAIAIGLLLVVLACWNHSQSDHDGLELPSRDGAFPARSTLPDGFAERRTERGPKIDRTVDLMIEELEHLRDRSANDVR